MVLDHVVALPADREAVAATRPNGPFAGPSAAWRPPRASDQALFAIVQGGLDEESATAVRRELAAMDFDGYAVGGLSVGEAPDRDVPHRSTPPAPTCRATSRGT